LYSDDAMAGRLRNVVQILAGAEDLFIL